MTTFSQKDDEETTADESVSEVADNDAEDVLESDITSEEEVVGEPASETQKTPKSNKVSSSIKAEEESKSPYEVLYRRIRPRRFSEIIGQDDIVKGLRSKVINNEVAQVYLFTGGAGSGKTTTARVLASALNCPFAKNGEPCGVCDLCVSVHKGYGSEGVRELDAASNSSVDDARKIISDIQFASGAKKNIYIIDEVHLLSRQANGTLLKTFEEPPENVMFILCTTNPESLSAAIRSRATVLNFRPLDDPTMEKLIRTAAKEADIDVSDEQIKGVVHRGNGSPRTALSALEALAMNTEATVEYQNHANIISNAIAQKDVAKIVIGVAKALDVGGIPVSELATSLLAYWRSMLLALNAPDMVKLSDKDFDEIVEVAESIGTDKIIVMLRSLGESHSRLSQGDPRVVLETTLIQFVIPHSDAASIREVSRKVDGIATDISELKKRPAASVFDSPAHPANGDNWLDKVDPEPEEKVAIKETAKEKTVSKSEPVAKETKKPSLKIIEDSDDLIEAIFAQLPKKLQLALSGLEINEKETNSEVLVLKSNSARLSEDDFDIFTDAIEAVDPRDFDLLEGA